MQYFHGAASESKLQVIVWLQCNCLSCRLLADVVLFSAKWTQKQPDVLELKRTSIKAWSKVTDPTCSDTRKVEATQANRNLNWEKHHLPTLGILLVEPDRKKTLNWSKKKRLLATRTLYSSSSLTWKRPRGNRQFSHLFIGWKGPRDDKTQNTHVLNSRASLGTSGNKMADKHRGLQLAFRTFDHEFIFRRRPQSRRRTEANIKEENNARRCIISSEETLGKARKES